MAIKNKPESIEQLVDEFVLKEQAAEMIAYVLALSIRHVKSRVMKRKDFPKPVKKVGRSELYQREKIMDFLIGGKP